MNFDFSFVPQYMPYYLEGVKYTLLISLITVFFGAIFGSLLFFMKTSNFHIWKIKPLKVIAVVYIPYYLEGVKYTLLISLITVLFGALFGSLLFFMKTSNFHIWKIKPLKIIAVVYIEIIRGTPMLLQILIMYAGSKMFFGIDLSPFTSAIIAIALNSAAYVSEIVRAGIEAVDKGQMEAARSLGMRKSTAMVLIVIPQAVKNILPAIGNEFVAIIKESSMASIIGVNELMFASKVVVGSTYRGLEPYIVAAGFYFIMTFTLGRIISLIERRMKKSDSVLIVIPQAVKNILPAIGNEFVAIIKESSMASIIGVNELMFASKVVVGSTYRGLEPYIVAAGFYFIMTFTLGRIISLIERRMKKSDSR